jgi:hypothetical protein
MRPVRLRTTVWNIVPSGQLADKGCFIEIDQEQKTPDSGAMFSSTPMIWLVDGDRATRDANLQTLSEVRCIVTTFKRGLDASLRLQSATPHLLILSRSLKDGCGINLAVQIRSMKYKGLIILLSAEDDYLCRAAVAKGIINLRLSPRLEISALSAVLPGCACPAAPQATKGRSMWTRLTAAVGH